MLHLAILPLATGRILPIEDVTGAYDDPDFKFLQSRTGILFDPYEVIFTYGELRTLDPCP